MPMKRERTYVYTNTVHKGADAEAEAIFGGPGELAIGPAPEFGGRPDTLNPEELFVAAINSCLMVTFFYFLHKGGIELQVYEADAEGKVQKGSDGFRFVDVQVHATATLKEPGLAQKVSEMAGLTEKYCLVSQSVSCPVHYHLSVEISGE
jgi:organic hydroperoxide reductase OsmC/OhrA